MTIGFDYPLSTPVQRQFHHAGGFTLANFAAAVADGYEQIYAEEEVSATADPAPGGMLLNRSPTNGVHGIWGHGIGDLVLECVAAPAARDSVWQLFVGS
jgi:hypothetical protein